MPASTLALSQASYELLEVLEDGTRSENQANTARVRQQGSRATLQADRRGGLIEDLGIQAEAATSLLITDRSSGLTYSDFDVLAGGPASANANLNILADADDASLELGAGDNRLNAARDLVDSEVSATTGSDTVRIGGNANGTFVALGDGNDQFAANRGGTGLDVAMGAGNDNALFIGTLTAGANSQTPFEVQHGQNLVDMGIGDDRATFINGVQGGDPGSSGYEIQLGAGNDTAVFGGKSSSDGFVLNTGTGSDQVVLGELTSNAVIDLGWDDGGQTTASSGDLVVLGTGASLEESGIRSNQSLDTLRLAGTVTDTSLDLGWGSALVEVDGSAQFGFNGDDTVWDLGAGDDSLIFGQLSDLSSGSGSGYINLGSGSDELSLLGTGDAGFSAIEFDLGNDGDSDTVVFGLDSSYSGFTISNFGETDILFIGLGKYGYGYQFLNEDANEWDLDTFQSIGNVIWSQEEDGGSIDQDVMTLAMDNFTPMSGDEGDTYSETTLPDEEETVVDYITTDTLESLSTTESWAAAGDAPMSVDPPTVIFPDDTPA